MSTIPTTEGSAFPPVRSVWQNYTSGRLVTITAVDRALDRVTFKYSTGRTRTLITWYFQQTYRPESEIRP